MPGDVFLPATVTGLPHDSVVNVTAMVTLNKADLADWVRVPTTSCLMSTAGLRLVLGL